MQRLGHFGNSTDQYRNGQPGGAHRACQCSAVRARNRHFTCGIHIGQHDHISLAHHLNKGVKAIARAGVAVRLEGEHQPTARECTARGSQRDRHFHRVMAIVIDHRNSAPRRQQCIAIALEAPANSAEIGQRLQQRGIANLQLGGNRNCRQRIQDVVVARQVQHHVQVGCACWEFTLYCEMHLRTDSTNIHGAKMRRLIDAIAAHTAIDAAHDVTHTRIVSAHHRCAIERHTVQEVHKRGMQTPQVMAIGFHMVGIDIRHHRHHRQQVQERRIRLIGLDDDVLAGTQPGIDARAVQSAANHKGRVQPALCQHAGDQTGRGRLAVGSGNRNALLHAHQLSQHLRAWHDGYRHLPGLHDFRVVGVHGTGCHHCFSSGHIAGSVADEGLDAQGGQPLQGSAVAEVRARHGVAHIRQHFGNAGHACATDADKMDVRDGVLHATSSSHA